jgi:hypothetical protein
MSDLTDVLKELEVKQNLTKELRELLEEIDSEEGVKGELDYSMNSKGATWGSLRVIESDSMEAIIAQLRELIELVKNNERDQSRTLANEIAETLKAA